MTDASGWTRAVLALGANLGDPAAALRGAVEALASTPGLRMMACSHAYRTEPVGGPEQPQYLNAVCIIETNLGEVELLDRAQRIEQAWGRVRDVRWGPRTLDIDLITVGDLSLATDRLTLPHPRAHERAFVLVPWLEIDPSATFPGIGPISEIVRSVDCSGIERTDVGLLSGDGSVVR